MTRSPLINIPRSVFTSFSFSAFLSFFSSFTVCLYFRLASFLPRFEVELITHTVYHLVACVSVYVRVCLPLLSCLFSHIFFSSAFILISFSRCHSLAPFNLARSLLVPCTRTLHFVFLFCLLFCDFCFVVVSLLVSL